MKSTTKLSVASACLMALVSCKSDSGNQYSKYHTRPTVIDGPAVEYSDKQAHSIQLALARSFEQERNWNGAEQTYLRILERNPKHTDACHRLAILYDRLNQFEKSGEFFKRALRSKPGDPNIFCDIGYSFYRQRRWADAEMNLKQATAINKKHARAHNHLGLLYAQLDQREQSLAEFKLAGCDKAQAITNIGLILSLNDRLEEAKKEYQLALNVNPTSDEIRTRLQKLDSVLAKSEAPVRDTPTNSPVQVVRHTEKSQAATRSVRRASTTIPSPSAIRKMPQPKRMPQTAKPTSVRPFPRAAAHSRFESSRTGVWHLANTPEKSDDQKPGQTEASEKKVTTPGRVTLRVNPAGRPAPVIKIFPRAATKSNETSASRDRKPAPKSTGRSRRLSQLRKPYPSRRPVAATAVRRTKRPMLPVLKTTVPVGIQPIKHEVPAGRKTSAVRQSGFQLKPITTPSRARSRSTNGLINLESLVPQGAKRRSKILVIE